MPILEPTTIVSPALADLGGKARSLLELERNSPARVPAWFALSEGQAPISSFCSLWLFWRGADSAWVT